MGVESDLLMRLVDLFHQLWHSAGVSDREPVRGYCNAWHD